MSIADTNLAVILDQEKARRLGYTDEQLFEEVAKQIRRIPGVKQVYEYQLTRAKLDGDKPDEENPEGIHEPYRDYQDDPQPGDIGYDRMRGDIYP